MRRRRKENEGEKKAIVSFVKLSFPKKSFRR